MTKFEKLCIISFFSPHTSPHTYPRVAVLIQQAKSKTKPVTMEEFVVMKREYLALQTKVFEAAFRLQDNLNQSQKGQPSLDTEDTGVQWKNDEQ